MLNVALAQINPIVGDLTGNSMKIKTAITDARLLHADVVVFCELVLTGYPPEDLLLKEHFIANNIKALQAIAKEVKGITAIVGFVDRDSQGRIYNAAAVISSGKIIHVYHKQELPNYGVFDEKRYFSVGKSNGMVVIKGVKVGVNICEDIWIDDAIYQNQVKAGAKLLINLSSSPYEVGKLKIRESLLSRRAKSLKCPIVYVNCVGGQDELVFDGASMVYDKTGKLIARAKQFEEELICIDLKESKTHIAPILPEISEIYHALVVGTRDYVQKNGFKKAALGLSGGIDSALVVAIAVDALGQDNVTAISMPSPYNLKATRDDARIIAKNLNITFHEISIKKILESYLSSLKPYFKSTQPNIAEENVQARIRGDMLMAFSNKYGWLILTTGNKSEMAAGYCTLYGDMSGGFSPLKDIFKTKVYELCRWRNKQGLKPIIPESVIKRAPTAELRPNQTDEASLGAYADLDQVLGKYIEQHQPLNKIVTTKIKLPYIQKTARLVDINEYKRRQAPPGVKITARAFGKDWRLPITNKYRE